MPMARPVPTPLFQITACCETPLALRLATPTTWPEALMAVAMLLNAPNGLASVEATPPFQIVAARLPCAVPNGRAVPSAVKMPVPML
jgi:hypothetical protein